MGALHLVLLTLAVTALLWLLAIYPPAWLGLDGPTDVLRFRWAVLIHTVGLLLVAPGYAFCAWRDRRTGCPDTYGFPRDSLHAPRTQPDIQRDTHGVRRG